MRKWWAFLAHHFTYKIPKDVKFKGKNHEQSSVVFLENSFHFHFIEFRSISHITFSSISQKFHIWQSVLRFRRCLQQYSLPIWMNWHHYIIHRSHFISFHLSSFVKNFQFTDLIRFAHKHISQDKFSYHFHSMWIELTLAHCTCHISSTKISQDYHNTTKRPTWHVLRSPCESQRKGEKNVIL